MNLNSIHWMKYSIKLAENASPSHLRVGVVLVSEQNKYIASAYAGEGGITSWLDSLVAKLKAQQIRHANSIYITINTLSSPTSFDINDVLQEVCVNQIYVGLPDPALTSYLSNDPIIAHQHVYRYPDELQREILFQNEHYFLSSKQSISHSPYYSENRISRLVIDNLKNKGFVITREELNAHKHRNELALLICRKYGIEHSTAISIVQTAISEAFNTKYGTYSYTDDTRSLDPDWKERFHSFYERTSRLPLSDVDIINVGVGGGHEAIILFSNCTSITFVDIAYGGLKIIEDQIPGAKTICASAGNLSTIPDGSHDLYISLRTYNSSFFDIQQAIKEAKRTLRSNSVIIISVANGFLCPEQQCIIPGLIVPGTEFIDIYRGMDTAKQVQSAFLQSEFKEIQLYPTNTEIFLSAKTN